MKLIVDGQLFQTPAWHRGMGKYSLELLAPLLKTIRNAGGGHVDLLLSNRLQVESGVEDFIRKKLDRVNIVYLDLMGDEIGNATVAKHNRKHINQYVESQRYDHEGVHFLILSIMQGGIRPVFPDVKDVKKLVIMYDLIPLMMHDVYLRNPITRSEYTPRIKELLKADVFLSISKTVANDLALYLGVDKERIVSIDGGPIPHSLKSEQFAAPDRFILMPTGNDLRKNNRRAILGFSEFNKKHNNSYHLLVTSFFKDHEIEQLSALSPNVIFTGNITGGQLRYLYENASAILFPSEYEGLGMPILEALEHNKPVACSNIPVFREMSTSAFVYFDPYSVSAIANALDRSVTTYEINSNEYKRILEKYSWSRSAEVLFKAALDITTADHHEPRRLAVVSANPASDSNAAKTVQENYAEMSQLFDVDYFIDPTLYDQEQRINYLSYFSNTSSIGQGVAIPVDAYDIVIYHLADTKAFGLTLFYALATAPGIVVLHDIALTNAWQGMIEQGLVSDERVSLESKIESRSGESETKHLASLLYDQRAAIVFSKADQKKVKKIVDAIGSKCKVYVANLAVPTVAYDDALSEKESAVTDAAVLYNYTSGITDFKRNSEISRQKNIKYDSESTAYEVLEVLRFGGVATGALDLVTPFVSTKYIGSRMHDENPNSRMKYIHDTHGERQFTIRLQEIIEEIRQDS